MAFVTAGSSPKQYFQLPAGGDGYRDVDAFLELADELARSLSEESLVLDTRRCDELFAEYVDLLRGIALRDSGVRVHGRDLTDVFRIADALPSLWGRAEGWGWRSVTMPSSEERAAAGASNALRMGFPEWTVWALPLVQTELGASFLTRAKVVSPGDPPEQVAVAVDIAATLVTGPAYALPALMLRLRPEEAVDPGAPASLRAAAILAALRRAGSADLSFGVAGVVDAVASAWTTAVVRAGAAEAEVAARPSGAELGLTVERVVAAMERATAVVGQGDSTVLSWARRWGDVLQWAGSMRAAALTGAVGQSGAVVLQLPVAEEDRPDNRVLALPMLISAAWLVRTGLDGAARLPDTAVEPLAAAVVDLCLLALPATDGRSSQAPAMRGANR